MEMVADVRDLDADMAFFESHGFRIEIVYPADDPTTVVMSRGATRVRLVRRDVDRPLRLREVGPERATLRSPGGSTIETEPDEGEVRVPRSDPALVVSRASSDTGWVTGRAGMRYRDLLPGRWGGRFIASHIHIPDAGPVRDYVHFHRIRFQLIVVKAGWVEVVYEDQGPPFVMHAGDAVLQPPEIRHRVLQSSAGLEVIEITCPAEHVTVADHDLELPTATVRSGRDFGGQRFARSILAERPAEPWAIAGYLARNTGFGSATGGLVDAAIVEPDERPAVGTLSRNAEFWLLVVLDGRVAVDLDDEPLPVLTAGDSVALPAATEVRLRNPTADLRLLEITVPA